MASSVAEVVLRIVSAKSLWACSSAAAACTASIPILTANAPAAAPATAKFLNAFLPNASILF
jgi:hypothetical protein